MNILIIILNITLLSLALIYPSYNLYVILGQLSLVLFYILYKIYTRKKMLSQEMILSNDIPNQLIPLIAGCLEEQRSCRYQDITATIIDLIKREYLRVEITEHYGKKEIIIKNNIVKDFDNLDIIEQSILHFMLRSEEKINLTEYIKRLTQDTNEVVRVKSLLSSISNRISAKYYSSNALIYITLIFSVVEFYVFSISGGNSFIMIPIFTLILIIIWFISFQAEMLTTMKTKYIKLQGKLSGFKTYLMANTKLEDFDTRYFSYLIAFDTIENLDFDTLAKKDKTIIVYQVLSEILDEIDEETKKSIQ